LFFAAVLTVIFRPLHERILKRCKQRRHLAAGLTTSAILLIVLVPAISVFVLAVIEGHSLLTQWDVATIKGKVETIRSNLGLEMPFADDVRSIESALKKLQHDDSLGDAGGRNNPVEHLRHRVADLERRLAEESAARPAEDADTVVGDDLKPFVTEIDKLAEVAPGTLEYDASLQVAQRAFRDFKSTLIGGSYRAWLVDLANPSDEQIRQWSNQAFQQAQGRLLSIGGATTAYAGRLVLGIVIMMVSVFFFLTDGPDMIRTVMRLSPLDDRYEEELLHEFDHISRAVVVATLLSAIVQGMLAGMGYWCAGLESVFLLTLLTAVMALVPFFGAASVWISVSAWLFVDGRTGAAIMLAIYGAAIVSMADNVIKPIVLHGQSKLHPLLALLSVLGGVQALGPIGILVGPMVVAFLQTLLNILHRELTAMD
jgi:predicted PurR-regulated permease PerM